MKHRDLPRAVRRAVGFMRFARDSVGASDASLFLLDDATNTLRGLVSEWDWTRTSFDSNVSDWPAVASSLCDGVPRRLSRENASGGESAWFERDGIVRSICIPIGSGSRAFGVFFFDFTTDVTVGSVALTFLSDMGARCARALTRVRSTAGRRRPRTSHPTSHP